MNMQLKFKASKLIEALDFVSIVDPRALTAQQNSAAYLFNCSRDKDGNPVCRIYSRGPDQVARAGFELDELDGEGLFTMPSTHVSMLREIPDDTVTIEARTENKTDGEAFVVAVRSTSGTKYEHTTYDPRLISPCDKDFEAALKSTPVEYNVGVLREALNMAKPFLPGTDKKGDVAEHFNTIQIFDQSNPDWAKGDGNLFCSDASRAFYFEFDDFKNKGFTIHMRHVGKLADFLGKCEGVRIYHGPNQLNFAVNVVTVKTKDAEGKEQTEMVNGDQIFCWNANIKTHTRYAYYALTRDKYVIIAPKSTLLKALKQAQILIDQKQDRVKLYYTHKNDQTGGHTIHFGTSESAGKIESFLVTTDDKKDGAGNVIEPSLEEDFDCYVNLDNFRSIIQDAIGNLVELRISPIQKDDVRRGGAMLRTIDEIPFDAAGKIVSMGDGSGTVRFKCKVTRFMPSTI
jgi:hypothetical protein